MNIVVRDSPWRPRDLEILFEEDDVRFVSSFCLSTLMVEIGAFPSSSKARQAGRVGPIPMGFTKFKASKKMVVWIWNPSE